MHVVVSMGGLVFSCSRDCSLGSGWCAEYTLLLYKSR